MKMVTKTVRAVDYRDFENEVKRVFGQEFEFPSDEECSNDTSHEYNNMKIEEHDEWDRTKLQEFTEGKPKSFMARILLQELVNRKEIPEGNYIIRVSW